MAKKERVEIPEDVYPLVLYRANRCCCVCSAPRKALQIHHIDEDPANNHPDNLAVLCLDCHNDTQVKGGFGRKLDAPQVRKFKEEWERIVENQRALGVPVAVAAAGPKNDRERLHDRFLFRRSRQIMSEDTLSKLLKTLWDQDAFYGKDIDIAEQYVRFWSAADNELIDEGLRQRCEAMCAAFTELLRFLGDNFFRTGDSTSDPSRQHVMHPRLNPDRAGTGKAEDLALYEAHQQKLYRLLDGVSLSWREFRRAIKLALTV